jgi:hypothetical protein
MFDFWFAAIPYLIRNAKKSIEFSYGVKVAERARHCTVYSMYISILYICQLALHYMSPEYV